MLGKNQPILVLVVKMKMMLFIVILTTVLSIINYPRDFSAFGK